MAQHNVLQQLVRYASFLSFLAIPLLGSASGVSKDRSEQDCAITHVSRFKYGCGIHNRLKEPAEYSHNKNVASVTDCWLSCINNSKCKSFRWYRKSTRCVLFSKFIDQMVPDSYNYANGFLYDNDCFTKDCNLITACHETARCNGNIQSPLTESNFTQYACAFGYTSRKRHAKSAFIELDGDLRPCDAIEQCIQTFPTSPTPKIPGSYDIFYYIPTAKWICKNYHDLQNPEFGNTSFGRGSQNIFNSRFMLPNESVGMAYGWWNFYTSYPYGE